MAPSHPRRVRSTPPPNAAPSTRLTPELLAWAAMFVMVLAIGIVGLVGGVVTHQLTSGRQILALGLFSIVVLSLTSRQMDRVKARVINEDQTKGRQAAKEREAELDANKPLTLTDEQLAWCHKNPTVGARLVALQRQRPDGVLLKRDMRELIDLRLATLTQARHRQKTGLVPA